MYLYKINKISEEHLEDVLILSGLWQRDLVAQQCVNYPKKDANMSLEALFQLSMDCKLDELKKTILEDPRDRSPPPRFVGEDIMRPHKMKRQKFDVSKEEKKEIEVEGSVNLHAQRDHLRRQNGNGPGDNGNGLKKEHGNTGTEKKRDVSGSDGSRNHHDEHSTIG
uniref:Skp1 domain-containing protein n=1 Tax=Caenorhabditis tropicalis TaxID=1561998 RepID=A0A1I7T371_9PELO